MSEYFLPFSPLSKSVLTPKYTESLKKHRFEFIYYSLLPSAQIPLVQPTVITSQASILVSLIPLTLPPFIHRDCCLIKKGLKAQSVKCLPWKHADLGTMVCAFNLGTGEPAYPTWCTIGQWETLFQEQCGQLLRNDTWAWPLAAIYTFTYVGEQQKTYCVSLLVAVRIRSISVSWNWGPLDSTSWKPK